MQQPAHGPVTNNNEWSVNTSPPSFIQDLPEFVKLILASLLVAITLHAYFSARRNKVNELQRGPDINGRVGAVGSNSVGNSDDNGVSVDQDEKSSISINEGTATISSKEGGQTLGSTASPENPATKKKNAKRNDVSNRNYDALICKISAKEDDEGMQQKISGKSSTGSNSESKAETTPEEGSNTPNSGIKKNGNDEALLESRIIDEQPAPLPPIELKSQANHPGLQGYWNWHATITSLYRIYTIPSRDRENNYHQAVLPMHPSSERGQVPVYIEVTNRTSHKIDVYWIDYKGNEVRKGSIPNRGGVWTQTTYIGHPWTFRIGPGEENVLLKYAPFRVIASIAGAESSRVEQDGNVEGMQKFVLRDVHEGHVTRVGGLVPSCLIEDEILPEPPLTDSFDVSYSTSSAFSLKEMDVAIRWSCQQMQREDVIYHGNGIASAKRLLQYLKNICLHPDDPKYRRLRLGNRIFQQIVYNTGARGVLLALGFEEIYGYMECGPGGGKMLPHERIQQISDAMMIVNQTLKIMEGNDSEAQAQPEGGDGFGRAGFGHAGGMNL
mmetsp:Transcript_37736/g.90955  ORF Transcript_37736/g.90955 Transcript_37736/m.90955 type:complete len:554 (+) Transcript_37736:302-1963(+)|eukprot:CAMPEP_0181086732 /NCGR_PEP_ID=MMETSP1071-20121207/5905_1 /TAXON_ID=35127 /ORGANISM="Thalassiosira sp., Strain NH16" /LENGTH=553 /DNA_ID=CAMNT_0023168591 /DNA_START=288 /DNA_END=1949 /DNA_ORIENTATION=+